MNLKKNLPAIAEWIIAIFLAAICVCYYLFWYGSFTAIDAFRASESSYHYGPSEIKKEINLKNGKIYLGRYKDWISINMVEKKLFKWYPGSAVGGYPINYSDKITEAWQAGKTLNNGYLYIVYGYVNDPTITTVNLQLKDKQSEKESTMKYSVSSDKLFIFNWENNKCTSDILSLTALDKAGNVVYEYKYPH